MWNSIFGTWKIFPACINTNTGGKDTRALVTCAELTIISEEYWNRVRKSFIETGTLQKNKSLKENNGGLESLLDPLCP